MIVNKIVLRGGEIAVRQELRTEDMASDLLQRASEVLSALRLGTPLVINPLPDGPEMTISLGMRRSVQDERDAKRGWLERHTEANAGNYERHRARQTAHDRKVTFNITYRGVSVRYELIPSDMPTAFVLAGQFGTIAGSYIGSQLRQVGGRAELDAWRAEGVKRIRAVALECVELRPAFIAPSPATDRRSIFGDHFAVVMLSSDAASAA